MPNHRAGRSSPRRHRFTRGWGHDHHPDRSSGRERRELTHRAAALTAVAALAFGGIAANASAGEEAVDLPNLASPPSVSLANVPPEHRDDAVIDSIVNAPRFADSYAGEVARDGGGVTLYATPSGMGELAAALERELGPPQSSTYELRPVRRSYKQLRTLTQRVSDERESLKSDGIRVVLWGPDPTSNTVKVQIADYTEARAMSIRDRLGEDVTVVPAKFTETLYTMDNRHYDDAFYFSGDYLWPGRTVNSCTAGFNVWGPDFSKRAGMTPAHCGGYTVFTNPDFFHSMGTVTDKYYDTSGGWDLELFRCDSCSSTGRVWYDSKAIGRNEGHSHLVGAPCTWCDKDPRELSVKQRVSIDGANTGQVPNNDILEVGTCADLRDEETGRVQETCDLNITNNPDANNKDYEACDVGDSGGPVYQRKSGSARVHPAGMLVGGNREGWYCAYHSIIRIQRLTGVTVIEAPY